MITVEGIIGAGKSTLVETLRGAGYVVAPEPVDQWRVGDHDLLKVFYANPRKYAYLFQMHVLNTLGDLTARMSPPPGFVTFQERSLGSNALFAKLQHHIGYLDDLEYASYVQAYEAMRGRPEMRVSGRIFLDTPVDVAMERVARRGRPGETVTRAYEQQLFDLHEAWKRSEESIGRPVLVLDTTEIDVRGPKAVRVVRDWIREFH